ncbi:MAG TPA: hypothetical protein VMU86_08255 [Steroidobacteraceae bacterium]|nr:hypothetical protein [Steroidobacteraceae bacterium]
MILVLVPHSKPLQVLRITEREFVSMVRRIGESGQYLATLPPGRTASDVEQAWVKYTSDMKRARRFEDVPTALGYYERERDGLSAAEHARILKLLHELQDAAG